MISIIFWVHAAPPMGTCWGCSIHGEWDKLPEPVQWLLPDIIELRLTAIHLTELVDAYSAAMVILELSTR